MVVFMPLMFFLVALNLRISDLVKMLRELYLPLDLLPEFVSSRLPQRLTDLIYRAVVPENNEKKPHAHAPSQRDLYCTAGKRARR